MNWLGTVKRGFFVGLETAWSLGKIIFPVTLIVSVLQYTVVIDWLVKLVSPLMGLFGLSGEAAIPLVLGNVLNLYAAIGAILSLDLTVKEVFIIAMMLSFCHSLFVETSIAKKVGVSIWVASGIRILLAALSAWIINLLWHGGNEQATYGLIPQSEEVNGWIEIIWNAIEHAVIGVFQLAAIVIPLMVGIQWLREKQWIAAFSRWMSPFTRMLGMNENTSTTFAAGILFGISFGAGVMLQAVKEDGVKKRDLYLVFIFLSTCHAVVEDTLIFVPLGIPVWMLFVIRLTLAIILTMLVASAWKRIANSQGKEVHYEN